MLTRFLVVAIGTVLATSADAQGWTNVQTSTTPSARGSAAMVYADSTRTCYLFGGYVLVGGLGRGFLDDTWAFDGNDWRRIPTGSAPSPRFGHAMTYDPARDRIVLFGGSSLLGASGDTWEFDPQSETWSEVVGGPSPTPRSGSAIAYDTLTRTTVMFGGFGGTSGPGTTLGDTWLFDGQTWTQASPPVSPPPRFGHGLSGYGESVLLYGGERNLQDTWAWSGLTGTWFPLSPSSAPTSTHRFSLVDAGNFLLLQDGRSATGAAYPNQTWRWNRSQWIQQTPSQLPPPVADAASAFDVSRNRVVRFGGTFDAGLQTIVSNDTWEYDQEEGNLAMYGAGCQGSDGVPVLRASFPNVPSPGQSFALEVEFATSAASGTTFLTLGLSDSNVGGIPLPFSLATAGLPGCFVWTEPLTSRPEPTSAGSIEVFPFQVPSIASLSGRRLFAQALVVDANTPFATAVSNGLAISIE